MNKLLISVVSFLSLFFCSCAVNKTVILSPQHPFEQYDNGIGFRIKKIQNWWISFQTPLVNGGRATEIPFELFVIDNKNLKNVYLKSISLVIRELGIEIKSGNLTIPLSNPNPYKGLFRTEDIQNSYPKKLSLDELYNVFGKVNEVQFITEVKYEIDGKVKESTFIWTYKAKRSTTSAYWDALMGI